MQTLITSYIIGLHNLYNYDIQHLCLQPEDLQTIQYLKSTKEQSWQQETHNLIKLTWLSNIVS
jgi:hypothetical protein